MSLDAAGRNPMGNRGERNGKAGARSSPWPRGCAGGTHLLPARFQQDASTEQAPQLTQQREEDVEYVCPAAHSEEEDEEASHAHQHCLVGRLPARA